jgi:hypothetical protein
MTSSNEQGAPENQPVGQDGPIPQAPAQWSGGEKVSPRDARLDELFDAAAKSFALGDSSQDILSELARLAKAKAEAGDPDAGPWAVGRLATQFAGQVGSNLAKLECALEALTQKLTAPFVRKAFEKFSTKEGVESCLGFTLARLGDRRLEVQDSLLPRLARDLAVDPLLVVARTLAQAPDDLRESLEWVEAWGRFANREYSRRAAKPSGRSVDELLGAIVGMPKATASTGQVQELFLSLCDDFPELASREQAHISASPIWTLLERELAYRGRVMDSVRGHSIVSDPSRPPARAAISTPKGPEDGQESRILAMLSRLEEKLEERTVLAKPVTRDILHKLPPMVQSSVGIFVGYIDEMLGDARKKEEMTRQAQEKVHQLQRELEKGSQYPTSDLQAEITLLSGELARSQSIAKESVRDSVNGERARARQIIEREIGNFNRFLETVDPEDPIAKAFIEQFRLRAECLQSRFPNLEWSTEEKY